MAVKIRQVDAPHQLRNAALGKGYDREKATSNSSLSYSLTYTEWEKVVDL